MKNKIARTRRRARNAAGMTLVEMMVAVALSSMLMAAAASLWSFGSRSFVAMGNYTDLDAKSRNALDQMSKEIRQATGVTAFHKDSSTKWFTVTNTETATGATYTWKAETKTLACQKAGQPERVYLTGCDRWDFDLFQRAPQTNGTYAFFPAVDSHGHPDLSICKLINMSWKSSRTVLGRQINTESVQTARVVLRNKQF